MNLKIYLVLLLSNTFMFFKRLPFIIISSVLVLLSYQILICDIDSLERAAKSASDLRKPEIYNDLAKAYQNNSTEKSIFYANLALESSQKSGDRRTEAKALFILGINYVSINKISEATAFFNKSLEIRLELGDKPEIATSYNAMGNVSRLAGKNQTALDYYFKSLEIRKLLGDKLLIGATYNNIGVIYKLWGNYEKALQYYLYSLKYAELAKDTTIIIPALINIGNIYSDLKNYRKSLDYYFKVLDISQKINNLSEVASAYNSIGTSYNYLNDTYTAINYFNKSNQLAKQIGNLSLQSNALNNLGESYHQRGDLDKALEYYQMSADLAYGSDDLYSNATSLNNIGSIYRSKKEYKKALPFLLKSLQLNSSHNNYNTIKENYINLAWVYEGLGDYKKAFYYYNLYSQVNDSLSSESIFKKINEIQFKYENDKKEKEILNLKKEREKESEAKNYLYALLILGILLIIVIFVLFLIKLKNNRLLEEKNQLISIQKDKLSETIENLNIINEANERYLNILSEELTKASDYVISLIPGELKNGDIKTQWMLKPSSRLGGDTFGYHWIDSDNLATYLLDVSGHGVGASLHAISILNTIKFQSLKNTDFRLPHIVLESLNKAFPMKNHNNLFFTIWYGVYNKITRTLVYASAGHPPAILIDESGISELLGTKNFIIGGIKNFEYSSNSIQIKPNAKLFIFSDGVYEIWDSNGNLWSIDELAEFIRKHSVDSKDEIKYLYNFVTSYHGREILEDDFSILKFTFI